MPIYNKYLYSPLNLVKLNQKCISFLFEKFNKLLPNMIIEKIFSSQCDLISSNAERKAYGLKSKSINIIDDESLDCLWYWELTNSSLLPQIL